MESGHLVLALHTQGQLVLELLVPTLAQGKLERHLMLGQIHCMGQTLAPPDTWVLAKGLIGYDSLIAIWRSGLNMSVHTHAC